jgi:hypothetical protein
MATSCTSASTFRRLSAGPALAFAAIALAAHAEVVPLPAINGDIGLAALDSARDADGWRLGVVRHRFPQVVSYGVYRADAGEDEYAFDCAKGDYTYARRTLTLAGVVVDDRVIPPSRWASQRFPVPVKGSIPALALERFCALKDVPAK